MSEEPSGGQNPLWGVISGLRGMAENVVRAAGAPLSELPALPEVATHPGAMSAAQLGAMRTAIQAQRDAVAAMQSQLAAFDEQLQVLQRLLVPLAEWSATWARLESQVVPGSRSSSSDGDEKRG
ncbi:hypothetical protein EV188_102638 [Actinomycetospora succinea]|uniref:Uncharacterized protein n=1 Tax=Actinomycetospora succinea TaxID=663603 RepID=A0A4R6VM23_9PSEU|nr:hypothetical protein [Actinomycetospora succinea]TDQ62981.1 hypothetical protein EV188_102638 [Actinomycetospora succinea]